MSNWIEILGYVCTFLTLLGFFLNARQSILGFYSWIIGDIGWVVYSLNTDTIPHAIQCLFIVILNIYGIYIWKKNKKNKKNKKDEAKTN